MMLDPKMLNFIPLVGVGPFRFGESVDNHNLELWDLISAKFTGDMYFDRNEKVAVFVDDENRIRHMLCDEEFFYKGRNLI